MKLENGKLILEARPCWQCQGTREVSDWVICPKCNGSGKADPSKPKGRNCECSRRGYARGKTLQGGFPCKGCSNGTQQETRGDYAPAEIWRGMRFEVYRSDRPQTIGEYLLAENCVYSCTDYGDHKRRTDAELVDKIRNQSTNHQACKFIDADLRVADHIGIFCHHNGYTVRAVWQGTTVAEVAQDLAGGLGVEEGFAIGERLASEGLNGTLAVTRFRR